MNAQRLLQATAYGTITEAFAALPSREQCILVMNSGK
jgi:hypothetical protein